MNYKKNTTIGRKSSRWSREELFVDDFPERNPRRRENLVQKGTPTDELESTLASGEQPNSEAMNQMLTNKKSELYSQRRVRPLFSGFDLDADSDTEVFDCVSSAVISDKWRHEYTYGIQELAKPDDLPFAIVKDDDFYLKRGKHFQAPNKLIWCDKRAGCFDSRLHEYGQPYDLVHYEINAHDVKWLEILNKNRKLTNGRTYLSPSQFIKIIEELEREAFVNIHNHLLDSLHVIYTPSEDEDDGDRECDVCRIAECNVEDEMVYCDNCNTCVHMLCVGLEELPTDEWICQKCVFSRTSTPPCVLCPALGGSMSYNVAKTEWTHHSCAMFVPEVRFLNEERRAPLSNCDVVSRERFKQLCAVCDTKHGACVTCDEPACEETFHVCCALRAGLTVRIEETDEGNNVKRVTFCIRHSISSNIHIDEKFRSARNPWLAKLESVFYVMASYETVAQRLGIEKIIASDVYEYWKLKRLERGSALIPNLHDHIRIHPTIERVARRMLVDEACLRNKAGISSGAWPRNEIQFFRPAALMVPELRELYLKSVGDSMKHDMEISKFLMKREALKRDMMEAESQQILLCRKMCHQSQQCSKSPQIDVVHPATRLISPLRPRNHHRLPPPFCHTSSSRVSTTSPGAQNAPLNPHNTRATKSLLNSWSTAIVSR